MATYKKATGSQRRVPHSEPTEFSVWLCHCGMGGPSPWPHMGSWWVSVRIEEMVQSCGRESEIWHLEHYRGGLSHSLAPSLSICPPEIVCKSGANGHPRSWWLPGYRACCAVWIISWKGRKKAQSRWLIMAKIEWFQGTVSFFFLPLEKSCNTPVSSSRFMLGALSISW
jgi:hypothetical protein